MQLLVLMTLLTSPVVAPEQSVALPGATGCHARAFVASDTFDLPLLMSIARTAVPAGKLFQAPAASRHSGAPAARPIAAVVPEPEVWATLIAGFALVGLALRRRARPPTDRARRWRRPRDR